MERDSMAQSEALRRERDRFVAFSFAAADLLMEVGPTGTITYVSGAARAVSGRDAAELVGKRYEQLFTEDNGPLIRRVLGRLAEGGRLEPIAVNLSEAFGGGRSMILGGCRLPGPVSQFYLTLSSPRVTKAEHAASIDETTGLLGDAAFQQQAAEVLRQSSEGGKDLGLTLLRLAGFEEFSAQAGSDATDRFLGGIGALLRACSLDGRTVGRIGEDKFGVVHASAFDASLLDARVGSLARAAAPGVYPPDCKRTQVDLSRGCLSEEEAIKALVFTISSFGKSSGSFSITSLAQAFEELLAGTIAKFKDYKDVVSENRFALAFQPIVDLDSGAVRHFEVLSRLDGGKSPYQMVSFAEELGVIEQFDLVVCKRALDYLINEGRGPLVKLAVNLSAQSLDSRLFLDALLGLLEGTRVEDKLLFEITESTQIGDLASANAAIQRLRERGFRVGLDDFGAGSASFPYLHALTIDFVKIDGAYVREVLNDHRSALILKAMCGLCRDLGVYTVAEMVETREQLEKLRELGVECGQGYLFGKPSAQLTPPDISLQRNESGGGSQVVNRRAVYQVWG